MTFLQFVQHDEQPPRLAHGPLAHEDMLPTAAQLEMAANQEILDAEGNTMLFKDLYTTAPGPENDRHLIIFVRHFFCGLCQDYTTTICSQLPPSALPHATTITFIGCGSPQLIRAYATTTSCTYPIFADPAHRLYDIFRMHKNLELGRRRPSYQISGMPYLVWKGIYQTISSGAAMFRGGHHFQLGGEMLFVGQKVSWCHRMTNTRSHTEVPVLKKVLEIT